MKTGSFSASRIVDQYYAQHLGEYKYIVDLTAEALRAELARRLQETVFDGRPYRIESKFAVQKTGQPGFYGEHNEEHTLTITIALMDWKVAERGEHIYDLAMPYEARRWRAANPRFVLSHAPVWEEPPTAPAAITPWIYRPENASVEYQFLALPDFLWMRFK